MLDDLVWPLPILKHTFPHLRKSVLICGWLETTGATEIAATKYTHRIILISPLRMEK